LTWQRPNAVLQKPDHTFLDPVTNKPFLHPIPRVSLPEKCAGLSEFRDKMDQAFKQERARIIEERRNEAIANGEPSASQLATFRRHQEQQGATGNMAMQMKNNSAQKVYKCHWLQ